MSAYTPDDRFRMPGELPAWNHPCWRDAPSPYKAPEGAADHTRANHPAHPAGRGWVPGSREIGLPSDPLRDAFSKAMQAFAALSGGEEPPTPANGIEPCWEHEDGSLRSYPPGSSLRQHHAFTPRRQVVFCEHLSASGQVRAAFAWAGISPMTAYRARRRCSLFAQVWDAALVLARAHAEGVLADRALNGVEEPVFYHGEEVARRRRYDNRLLLAHLGRLDRRCAEHQGAEHRFDQLLAQLTGHALPGDMAWDDGRLPAREDYVEEARNQARHTAIAANRKWNEKGTDPILAAADAATEIAAADYDAEITAIHAHLDKLAEEDQDPPRDGEGDRTQCGGGGSPPAQPTPGNPLRQAQAAATSPSRGGSEKCPLDPVTPVTPSPDEKENGPKARKRKRAPEPMRGKRSFGEGTKPSGPERPRRRLRPESALQPDQLDRGAALAAQADLLGGRLAEVDHAVAVERPAVVDPHDHRLAGVGHADFAAHRQGAVRGGQLRGVEPLAVGGPVAGELGAVPAGDAVGDVLEDRVAGGRGGGLDFGDVGGAGDCRLGDVDDGGGL
jgi:hypothetical protein